MDLDVVREAEICLSRAITKRAQHGSWCRWIPWQASTARLSTLSGRRLGVRDLGSAPISAWL